MLKKILKTVMNEEFLSKLGKVANIVTAILGVITIMLSIAHKITLITGNKSQSSDDDESE
jgi:hypothetical protein